MLSNVAVTEDIFFCVIYSEVCLTLNEGQG